MKAIKRRRLLLLAAVIGFAGSVAAKPLQGLTVLPAPRPVAPLAIADAQGRAAGLDTLAGKAVVLNLWASWCLPCLAELPALDRLAGGAAPDGVAVMAVSLDKGGAAAVDAAYGRLGIRHLPVRLDAKWEVAEALAAPTLPTTLLLDRRGREVARYVGAARWDGPEALVLLRALADGRALTPAMAPPPATLSGTPP
ncbi:MAG: TlpA disulfide reductase family protein [Magnetospirillum sp.]|nr:TlpA disulfide reductase family protein [Magnetospirillum sp.]